MDNEAQIERLFALSMDDLLSAALSDLPGGRVRGDPEERVWSFLKSLSDDVRGRACAVLGDVDLGEMGNVQGAAMIADLLAAASGRLTPFALGVFVLRRGREQLCGAQ
jgi:hypothetical protein